MTGAAPHVFEAFPQLRGRIAWTPLVRETPVHRLEGAGRELGLSGLWVKRDDLTSDLYGGNKPRKLEFVLADALARGCDTVLTYGGFGSHHALATALFARRLGLRAVLALHPMPTSADVRKTLLLDRSVGAELVCMPSVAKVFKLTGERLPDVFRPDYLPPEIELPPGHDPAKVYNVAPGGSSPLGVLGFVNAAFELKAQVARGLLPEPDYIFVAAGTVGTLAGLHLGTQLAGLGTQVVGVRVAWEALANARMAGWLAAACLDLIQGPDRELSEELSANVQSSIGNLQFLDDYAGRGYAEPTPEAAAAIEQVRRLEGLELDMVYTAKAFAGLADWAAKGRLTGATVLYWHTLSSADLSRHLDPAVAPADLPPEFRTAFPDLPA